MKKIVDEHRTQGDVRNHILTLIDQALLLLADNRPAK
jgi:hypothetical protein